MNNLDSMTMWELVKLIYSVNAEILSRVWVYVIIIGVLLIIIGETIEYIK